MRPKPDKLIANYRVGAGWEVDAIYPDGVVSAVLQTGALVKYFAYAPWMSPFTPQEYEDMVGEVLAEMAAAWNEKHGKISAALDAGEKGK